MKTLDDAPIPDTLTDAAPGRRGLRIPQLRWIIVTLLFLAAALNYIDRNLLALQAPTIQKDLGIDNKHYAMVQNFFMVAYTISYLLSGRIVDWLGERASMVIFIAWWSLSNALTSVARSARSLSCFRFMLGLGEAGGFTVPPKAVSEWFPAKERGLAVGIYSIGGAVGATIAPALITFVSIPYGWRWTFLVTPLFAVTWIGLWLALYRRPAQHPWLTDREREYLAANAEPAAAENQPRRSESALWAAVFSEPSVWLLMGARFLTDPVWYFYQNWFAKYLYSARGLTQYELVIVGMVFVAADIGFLLGGLLSGRLIRRGSRPAAARLWIMLISACTVPLAVLIPQTASLAGVMAISMLVVYAHTAWLSNLTALVVDVVPKPILGTSFGLIACGSTLGGIFMNQYVGGLASTPGGYDKCFLAMLVLHPAALALAWGLRRRGPA